MIPPLRMVVMLRSSSVSDPRSLSSAEDMNPNHLGGIHTFMERCGRIAAEEMRGHGGEERVNG
jgi:hypothetical protein